MTKNVLFNVGELADLYALKTLYNHLINRIDANFFFRGNISSERSRLVLEDVLRAEENVPIDVAVSTISDVSHIMHKCKNLRVDITILKNCAEPLTLEEKLALRKQYDLPSDQPVLTIGYSSFDKDERKIIEKLYKSAIICLVGHTDLRYEIHPRRAQESVRVVQTYGILKDYYAMADAALNSHNLRESIRDLHNFVEATEGGPLFMISPKRISQYGYQELVNLGVIREYSKFKNLLKDLMKHLKHFKGNEEHTKKRNAHIEETRTKYLPVIESYLSSLLNKVYAFNDEGNLIITEEYDGFSIKHENTHWR